MGGKKLYPKRPREGGEREREREIWSSMKAVQSGSYVYAVLYRWDFNMQTEIKIYRQVEIL
jgi:hypothetical protein